MTQTPATALLDHLAVPMARVNDLIAEHMRSPIPLIPQIGQHITQAGGKRIRPLMTLAAAQLAGAGDMEQATKLAAAVEFIHTATLLHDDVVDGSDLRRGMPTANRVWGNKATVLVGDFLFSHAFELMVAVGRLDVLDTLSKASAKITEGEVHQLKTANDLTTTQAEYMRVIGAKTAALFEAAMEVGGLVSTGDAGQVQALATYGYELGLAFQMTDDALDFATSQTQLGKAVGDDFREGKVTLPIILAYAAGDAEQQAFWVRTVQNLKQSDDDLQTALVYLRQHDALGQTLQRSSAAAARAKAALAVFPESRIKTLLLDLADFAVERSH